MLKLRQHPYWLVFILAVLAYGSYQGLIASDRYLSNAYIVLDSPRVAPPSLDFGAILSGTSGSGDLLLLREYLLSTDMLRQLDEQLDLRQHYSSQGDYFSRLRRADVPIETFHAYYLRRVEIKLDEYSNVLRIRAQAFEPEIAHAITITLLRAGETHMNAMGQRLATEQVHFIEQQVAVLAERVSETREALLTYQNKHGLISPRAAVESLSAVVAQLESELALAQARRAALASSQSHSSSEMIRLQAQINALQKQIEKERARMATQAGDALNRITIEYETLELQAQFAQELYSSALAVLENTRVEAARQLKQISVLQAPTLPEYSTQPRRLYNTTVFTLLALLAAIIAHLLVLIIRDHKD